MRYQLASLSLRGGRATNQDRIVVHERGNAVIMAVADGLGGHSGGDIAAEILTQTTARAFDAVRRPVIERPPAFLALTILEAHRAIVAQGKARRPALDPRTTCVVCLVQEGWAFWAHVGDSRLYHFRRGRLLRRTQDHTTIEALHQDGLISEEEMVEHPDKHHLLRCLGGPQKPLVSLGEPVRLERDDVLLLCTDGLWEALTPPEILAYLGAPVLEVATEEMLRAAVHKRRERADNTSAVVLHWEEETVAGAGAGAGAGAADRDPPRARRSAAAPAPAGGADADRGKPLQQRIDELEEYLQRFERKG